MSTVQANALGIFFFSLNRNSSCRAEILSSVLLFWLHRQGRKNPKALVELHWRGMEEMSLEKLLQIECFSIFSSFAKRALFQPPVPWGRFSDGSRILTAHGRDEPVARSLAPGPLCRRAVTIARAWWVSKRADLLRKLSRTIASFFLWYGDERFWVWANVWVNGIIANRV